MSAFLLFFSLILIQINKYLLKIFVKIILTSNKRHFKGMNIRYLVDCAFGTFYDSYVWFCLNTKSCLKKAQTREYLVYGLALY
jgi:hypothetical protein